MKTGTDNLFCERCDTPIKVDQDYIYHFFGSGEYMHYKCMVETVLEEESRDCACYT